MIAWRLFFCPMSLTPGLPRREFKNRLKLEENNISQFVINKVFLYFYILSKGILWHPLLILSLTVAPEIQSFMVYFIKWMAQWVLWLDKSVRMRQLGEKRKKEEQTSAKRLYMPNGKWEDVWRKRKKEQQASWYLHFTAREVSKLWSLLNDQFQTLEVQAKHGYFSEGSSRLSLTL